jgi:opacity protein-like surface antigen
MKSFKSWSLLLFALSFSLYCFSQGVTTSVYSGINFSDIHGQPVGGKWVSKPGASEGLTIGYAFNKTFGIQSGIGFSAVSYEYRTSYYQYPYPYYDFSSSSYRPLISPYYYPANTFSDFTFMRVPLLLTVSVPSTVQFSIRAGLVFSFVQNFSSNTPAYYNQNTDNIKKRDFGYLFSSGISYPLNTKINLGINFNYLTGRKKFMENSNGKHGYSEITLGLEYNFLKIKNQDISAGSGIDSSSKKVTVTYSAGLIYSWNPFDTGNKKYSSFTGHTLGFSVNLPLGRDAFFVTGVSFERKGYVMKDSSTSYYRYFDIGSQKSWVDTKIIADYAVIPFILRLPIDRTPGVFIITGPWLGLRLNARTVGVAYSNSRSVSGFRTTRTVVYDDIGRLVNDNELGWLFGCGVSLPLPGKYLVDISAQFNTGFNELFNRKVLNELQPAYSICFTSDWDHITF